MADQDYMDAWRTGQLVEDGDQPWQWYSPADYNQTARTKKPCDDRLAAIKAFKSLISASGKTIHIQAALDPRLTDSLSAKSLVIYVDLITSRNLLAKIDAAKLSAFTSHSDDAQARKIRELWRQATSKYRKRAIASAERLAERKRKDKEYKTANREKIKASRKAYNEANAERNRISTKMYKVLNQEKYAATRKETEANWSDAKKQDYRDKRRRARLAAEVKVHCAPR